MRSTPLTDAAGTGHYPTDCTVFAAPTSALLLPLPRLRS